MTELQTKNEEAAAAEENVVTLDSDASARIAELEKQVAELKDRALREMAEAENTRRRSQKEREDTSKYAVASFAKEILGVADNFARALEATPRESSDPAVKNLMSGIEATERQLQATLDRFGIKRIDTVGVPFDPNFHRVMVEMPSDQPAGTIVQVMQPGYIIHDRLLREALVGVSKGGSVGPHVDTSA